MCPWAHTLPRTGYLTIRASLAPRYTLFFTTFLLIVKIPNTQIKKPNSHKTVTHLDESAR